MRSRDFFDDPLRALRQIEEQVKRDPSIVGPMTRKQEKRLLSLLERHNVVLNRELDSLTWVEASRCITELEMHGRLPDGF